MSAKATTGYFVVAFCYEINKFTDLHGKMFKIDHFVRPSSRHGPTVAGPRRRGPQRRSPLLPMASTHAQQIEDLHFRVLKLLQDKPDISQRDLAAQLGISHGKMNYCLNALMEKGLVKLQNFSSSQHRWRYAYVLTPAGFARKAALTSHFLKRKMAEYEALKAEIDALKSDLPEEALDDISGLENTSLNSYSQSS